MTVTHHHGHWLLSGMTTRGLAVEARPIPVSIRSRRQQDATRHAQVALRLVITFTLVDN